MTREALDGAAAFSTREFRERGHAMIDFIADYWESLHQSDPPPVRSTVAPGEILARLPLLAPMHPEPWDQVMRDVETVIMPGLTHWQSPSFFAYFPANGSGPGVLGDVLSSGLGVNGMLWATSPAATELETRMLDWMAAAIGLPDAFRSTAGGVAGGGEGGGGGVIQGTASESTLIALLAARRRARSCGDHRSPTIYTSTQAHSSIVKAAMIAGFADSPDDRTHLRLIETDEYLRMRPDLLAEAMRHDANAGRCPIYVCATVGTTSSGAVDPLPEIARIASEYGAWVHVDAAWAGAACICPEHRGLLAGVVHADSICFNPHKWLLTNFDCDLFWTRDRASLTGALSITPEYLRNAASDAGRVIDYRDWQIPLGRRFRALKLWFVMRHYGIEGLQTHIREHVRLGEIFESLVRTDDRFEVSVPRSLSLVCFRLRPRENDSAPGATDARNKRLLDAINATGRIHLIHTTLPTLASGGGDRGGGVVLRMAIGGTFTRESHVRRAWEVIREAADRVS